MKTAAGIVTDHGGSTGQAAIVARELGVPAVGGTETATTALTTGVRATISCAGGRPEHMGLTNVMVPSSITAPRQ